MLNDLWKLITNTQKEISQILSIKHTDNQKKRRWDVVNILILLISTAYYLGHSILSGLIPIVMSVLLLNRIVFTNKTKFLKISLLKAVVILTVVTFLLAIGYIAVFYLLLDHNNLFEYGLIPTSALSFFKYFMISLLTTFIYIIVGVLIGDLFLGKLRENKNTSKASYFFISISLGLCISGIILFFLGLYSILNVYVIEGLILIVFVLKRDRLLNILKYTWNNRQYSMNLEISSKNNLIYIIIFSFIPIYLISVIRPFTFGVDGLRSYLNIVTDIAASGRLPTTYVNLAYPFGTEILISPSLIFGGVPVATMTMYTLGLIYILGFYLILKDFVRIKSLKDIWVLFPAIFFVPFMRMYFLEFKIDVFSNLLGMAVFYITYLLIKHRDDDTPKSQLFYIQCFISGFLITVKLITILYIAPNILYALYLVCSSNKIEFKIGQNIKLALLGFVFFIIPLLPWAYLYSRDLPYLQNINTRVMTIIPNTFATKNNDIPECYNNILGYENTSFMGQKGTGGLSYVHLPINYLKDATSNASLFSLIDPGLFFSLLIYMFLIVYLYKVKNIYSQKPNNTENFKTIYELKFWILGHKNLLLLGIPTFISIFLWILITPLETWYGSTQILLFLEILFVYIYITEYKDLLKQIIVFISFMCILQLSISVFTIYLPLNYNYEDIFKVITTNKESHLTITDDYEIAAYINAHPEGKVLYSSGVSFVNLHFFENKFYDRSLYYDYLREKDLDKAISKYGVKFIVINRINSDSKITLKCLIDNTKYVEDYAKSRNLKLLKHTKAFDLYRN